MVRARVVLALCLAAGCATASGARESEEDYSETSESPPSAPRGSRLSTPYGSRGFRGGYSEMRLSARGYEVSFVGNGFTGAEQVRRAVLRRAAELAISAGFDGFWLVDRQNDASESPTSMQTNCRHQYGGDIQCSTQPGMTIRKHAPSRLPSRWPPWTRCGTHQPPSWSMTLTCCCPDSSGPTTDHTLKRKLMTSPSGTRYSLPSRRSLPASRHLASLPSLVRSSQRRPRRG